MPDRLKFDVDVTAADTERRIIEGVAVPYGESARLGGVEYRFHPGSLTAARSRTPLLLSHDDAKPIGILASLDETDRGVIARFRVDETPDGDTALAQAKSGSRGGLSIGATIDTSEEGADGVVDVSAASLWEISLCAIPAFAGADVLSVTASTTVDETHADDPDGDTTEPDTEPDTPTNSPEETPDMTDDTDTTETIAAAAPVVIRETNPAALKMTVDDSIATMLRAAKGDADAQRVTAAWTSTLSADVDVLPSSVVSEILGALPVTRGIANAVRHRPLPPTGLEILGPKWAALPTGGWMSTPDEAPASSKIGIAAHSVTIKPWSWGTEFPAVLIERGSVDLIENAFVKAAEAYYVDVEKDLVAAMVAAVGAKAGQKATKIGDGIAKSFANSNTAPNLVVCAADVYGKWIDAEGIMRYSGGAVSSGMGGNVAGLTVIPSPYVAAGKAYVMPSNAISLRENSPEVLRFSANALALLHVQIAVLGFAAVDAEVPASIVEVTIA